MSTHSLLLRAKDGENGCTQIIQLHLPKEPPCTTQLPHDWQSAEARPGGLRAHSGTSCSGLWDVPLC